MLLLRLTSVYLTIDRHDHSEMMWMRELSMSAAPVFRGVDSKKVSGSECSLTGDRAAGWQNWWQQAHTVLQGLPHRAVIKARSAMCSQERGGPGV